MSSPRRSSTLSAACLGLALFVVACADEATPEVASDTATIEPTLAAVLADGADRLADHLAAADPCAALEEADLLRTRAQDGAEDGTVSAAVAREVGAVTDDLVAGLTCDEDTEDRDSAPVEGASNDEGSPAGGGGSSSGSGGNAPTDNGNGNDGNGKAKGQDKGAGKGKGR